MGSEQLILDVLKENGKITDQDIEKAEKDVGVRAGTVLELLVLNGSIKETELVSFLAEYFSMGSVKLDEQSLPLEVTQLVPAEFVRDKRVVPVKFDAGILTVAMTNPMDVDTIDNLAVQLNKNEKTRNAQVETLVAGPVDVQSAIDLYYRGQQLASAVEAAAGGDYESALKNIGEMISGKEGADEAPIIRFVSAVISQAYRSRASDIHIEPLEKRIRIRYRIDGELEEMDSPPKRLQGPILSRLKIMAGMNMAERRLPQDGRIKFSVDKVMLDLRVSALPGTHGESVVMRILDKSSLMLGLNELGFLDEDEKRFRRIIGAPNGVFLVTGPTGSGKTTTLYGVLNFLNRPDVKLVTVEDPVEYMLGGVNQVQVNDEIGFGFSQALRSILRQAPNIIMVGEIRDTVTAEIATQAALTGHLVFSTLHTNDAPSAVTRLIDMGVKPFLVASAVMGIMAQRLVRTVCKECREETTPDPKVVKALRLDPEYVKSHTFYKGRGCDKCRNTGYKGRKGIFELLEVNDEIRHLIYQCVPSNEIRVAARKHGMSVLREDALKKAERGITTLEEVLGSTVTDIA
ncbi:type II/IV secretion system protein [bacterium]|nr:type II/IV secretion system protein [bacterium]